MDDRVSLNNSRASAVIWNWKTLSLESEGPSAGSLRTRGLVQGVIALLVGGVFHYFDLTLMSYIAFSLGAIFAMSALFSPTGLYATLDRGGQKLGIYLGNLVKWLLLPLLYFGFFLPFKVMFRKGKKDTLKRYYDSASSSYWSDREEDRLAPGTRKVQF